MIHVRRFNGIRTLIISIMMACPVVVGMAPAQVGAAEHEDKIRCDDASTLVMPYPATTMLQLKCDLAGTGMYGDAITIIDRSGDTPYDAPWHHGDRLVDSIWIFDVSDNATADFVLDFRPQEGQLVARLYQAANSGGLAHTIRNGDVSLSAELLPAVTVTASDGWWTDGERINFNLDIVVDGRIRAGFSMPEESRSTDGNADFTIRIRDFDNDGLPDKDWRTVHDPGVDPVNPIFRTYLMVNEAGNGPPLKPVFPWPYLGPLTYGYLTSTASDVSQAPIQLDWDAGEIAAVGEFVASRSNDGQWFVYSYNPIRRGEHNEPNFEAPFAWYDLANDSDSQPELSVRFGYFPSGDDIYRGGRVRSPVNFIRYTWDQNNDSHWDYKLGMLGSHEIESSVRIGDLTLNMVPYDELPGWVIDRAWPVVTFVAAQEASATGEGIYDWDPTIAMENAYFLGGESTYVDESMILGHEFAALHPGFRGEYQFEHQGQIRLYVSPVDRQLHLFHAASGVWNKQSGSRVHYFDHTGDGYFDQWTQAYTDGSEERLSMIADHLVYSGSARVIIRELPDAAPLLETRPPRNHQEWLELGRQLTSIHDAYKPETLRQMIDAVPGDPWVITGAEATGLRETDSGYRFVLHLFDNFFLGKTGLEGINGPGRYIVDFDTTTGRFDVRPSIPSIPMVVSIVTELQPALEPSDVHIRIENAGLEDVATGRLSVYGVSANGVAYFIGEQQLDMLAEDTRTLTFAWSPPYPGEWTVHAELTGSTDAFLSEKSVLVTVTNPSTPDIPTVIRAAWPSANSLSYAGLLAGVIGFVAAACVFVGSRRLL